MLVQKVNRVIWSVRFIILVLWPRKVVLHRFPRPGVVPDGPGVGRAAGRGVPVNAQMGALLGIYIFACDL